MMRLRTRFLAVLAIGMLAAQAPAATIEVTTTDDIVAPDDDLCSIREAVSSSARATVRSSRSQARRALGQNKDDLTAQLPRLRANTADDDIPGVETYPRTSLLAIAVTMETELAEHSPVSGSEEAQFWTDTTTAVANLKANLEALLTNPDLPYVETAIVVLTDAITAIENEEARLADEDLADGCEDGSMFDSIVLEAKVYTLDATLELVNHVEFKGAGAADTTIRAGGAGFTLMHVAQADQIKFRLLSIDGARVAGDGGAFRVDGVLTLEDVTIRDNRARNGGAIWTGDHGGVSLLRVRFLDNRADADGGAIYLGGISLDGEDVTFGTTNAGEGNVADNDNNGTGRGGAVFVAGTGYEDNVVGVKLARGSIVGNAAVDGSAIATAGVGVTLRLANVTIAQNAAADGAAVAMDSTEIGVVTMNNVTLIENASATGSTAGLRISQDTTAVEVSNSLIAANTVAGSTGAGRDADCDLRAVTPDPLDPSYVTLLVAFQNRFNRNFYENNSVCPGLRWEVSPVNTNYELPASNWSVVDDGDPNTDDLLQAFDVDGGYYLPAYPDDASDSTENRLVNRGATALDMFACASNDQRGKERASVVDSDCDIGAVEFQIGRRADDEVTLFVNERKCLNVVENDIGDASYSPGSLQPLATERGDLSRIAQVVLASDIATDCPNPGDFPDADADGIPDVDAILYTPLNGFRGENILTYSLDWETGPLPTDVRGTVSGYAMVQTDVRSQWSSSSLGAAGLGWFAPVLLLLLRLPRRRAGALAAVLLACFAMVPAAQALPTTIYVNSDRDDLLPVPGDGACTLREALITARNDWANLTEGDCVTGNEGPDIIELTEDAKDIRLTGALVSYGGVTVRCGTDVDACRIWRDTSLDGSAGAARFRLFQSNGSITFERVTLEGGYAPFPEDGDSGLGGAIYATGNVTMRQAVLRNNTALAGGGLFLAGLRSDLNVYDSTFVGNLAIGTRISNGGGGAVATSASNEHGITILSSTFLHNGAIAGAGALQLRTLRPVVVANSTFTGNNHESYFNRDEFNLNGGRSFDAAFPAPFPASPASFMPQGAGVLDVSGAYSSITLRNNTIIENLSGAYDDDLIPATPAIQYSALEAGTRGITLSNSIFGNNYDAATLLQDRNCGSGAIATYYNLFGENPLTATCTVGFTNKQVTPSALYNDVDDDVTTTSDSTGYLKALGTAGGGLTQVHVPDKNVTGNGVPADTLPDDQRIIIDAGSAQGYVAANESGGSMCAKVDQRGVDREAGVRCDRGSFEWQQLTARDDEGYNSHGTDRSIFVDLLRNDLSDPEKPIRGMEEPTPTDCNPGTTDDSVAGQVRLLDDNGNPCVVVYLGSVPKEEVSFLAGDSADNKQSTESPWVLRYENTGNLLIDKDAPVVLTYRIYDNDGGESNSATIELYALNVPPRAKVAPGESTVHVKRGQSVTIRLADFVTDPDPDPACANPLDLSTLEFVTQPQFGTLKVDAVAGTITWRPDNSFNPFTDTFSYRLKDCQVSAVDPATVAATSNDGIIVIAVDHADDSGGAAFTDQDISDMLGIDWLGGAGGLFLVPLLLAGLRNRSRR